MYDLAVQGYADFARYGTVLDKRKIASDGLSGLVNGSNLRFQTSYFPILTSGSLSVTVSGSPVSGVADYDTGEVVLSAAPAVQPKATYTFTPYNTTDTMRFLVAGFDEMELRWNRDWQLVTVTGAAADETSTNAYIANSSGSEPACGNSSFSANRTQIAFYLACVEYRFRLTQFGFAANSDYMYRSTGGITVDKSRRPGNLNMVMAELEKRVERAMRVAQEQYYPDGSQWGAYVPSIHSLDYVENFAWQSGEVYTGVATTSYVVSLRQFGGAY